ncbi:uncharacterized protein LOC142349309 [Convolutriloba macropyga]|uniref:uncharacterized protein LOC142349309 n=1 Tax=Convolutriloba macropyga TaxID=536237 RepID=UPI003F51C07A
MSLTVKAFFKDEIRRIPIEASSASSFELLEEKIRSTFFDLPARGRLAMQWKDSDGDLITFSTDNELIDALGSVSNGVFKVYMADKDEMEQGGQNGYPSGLRDFVENLAGNLAQMGAAFDLNSPCGLKRTSPESNVDDDDIWTSEQKEKLNLVSGTICDGAKMKLADVCRPEISDDIEGCIEVALRSAIKRAVVVQTKSGFEAEVAKKIPKKLKKESSSSSSSEDSDVDSETEISIVKVDQRGLNKKLKSAVKETERLAFKEVNEHFGKLAAKWASQAVAQTMRESLKQFIKNGDKDKEVKEPEDSGDQTKRATESTKPRGCDKPTSSSWVPPNLGTAATPLNELGNFLFGLGSSAMRDDKAIKEAVDAFKNMGFQPDEKLIEEIKKAQGDIARVFENMKQK